MDKRTFVRWGLLVLVGGWAGSVLAQEEETPSEILVRAADLARHQRFDEAIGLWMGVLGRLDGSERATAEKKLGIAFQQTDRWPEAWHYLSLYLASPSGQGDETAAGFLQDVEDQLRKTHVRVTFRCTPDALTLHIPGSKTGDISQTVFSNPESPIAWWFLPGMHEVRAEADGYQPVIVDVEVSAGGGAGAREICLTAVALDEDVPGVKQGVGESSATLISQPAQPESSSRMVEWGLMASGVAVGLTGALLHGLAYSNNEELDNKYLDAEKYPDGQAAKHEYDLAFNDQVRPKEISAYVLYGIGGTLLLAGIVTCLVSQPDSDPDDRLPLNFAPLTLPGGGGAMMTVEW